MRQRINASSEASPKTNSMKTSRTVLADNKNISYQLNHDLPIIKNGYPGNLLINGRFVNEFPRPDRKTYTNLNVLKWPFISNPQRVEKRRDRFRVNIVKNEGIFDSSRDMIVWLRHSTFLIRLDGVTMLTDPCMVDLPCVRSYCKPLFKISEIRNIDYLLISHIHRDHMDLKTIKGISSPSLSALAPLNVGSMIKKARPDLSVQEAGWYQRYNLNTNNLNIYFLPSYHWSMYGVTGLDRNKSLWGSFIIQGSKNTVYFAGDTAYSQHFSSIAALFPRIDISIMPVGAYKPDYLFKLFHMPPEDAVTASNELNSKIFIPMHYGTFDLSEEPSGEPVKILKKLESDSRIKGTLKLLDMGEVFYL
jgi:L-ascorbate metabolism protein UlaG (beta-lactamase superfamily)